MARPADPGRRRRRGDGLLTRASHQQAGSLTLTRHAQHGLVTRTTLGTVIDDWTYSTLGEVQRHTATVSSLQWFDQQFTRDAVGRISQVIETVQGVQRVVGYAYDAAGRLIAVSLNGLAPTTLYGYDQNGNRTSMIPNAGSPAPPVAATYDEQDRLLQQGATTFTYTANGELATRTDPTGVTEYTYDEFGNLVTVLLPDGRRIDYVIDGLHRRVGKKIDGTLVRAWLYADQLRPVAELDGAGNIISRFVYGTDVNVPDVIIKGTDRYRIVKDHLGSPRLVIHAGVTPTLVQRLDYDPFGVVIGDSNPGFQPFGFAGGLYDPDTKLVRFGARDYDASIGRWTSKDPIRFVGRRSNLYSYAGADPVNWIDLNGLTLAPAAVGAVVGAVSGALGAVAAGGDARDVAIGAAMGAYGGAWAGGLGLFAGLSRAAIAGASAMDGASGAIGNFLGQAWTNISRGRGPQCINWGSLAGSAIGSALGGAMSNILSKLGHATAFGQSEAAPWANNVLQGIGLGPSVLGEQLGGLFGHNGPS